ncbi:MAG: 50S ribosomal protein L15 [Planctomycetes bacterium]|nr:50S ribosomal protein L15 [Planctomycetota bacterium]
MNLEDINGSAPKKQGRIRRGRGRSSGKGKTAGRGHKGQQCRSGYSRRFGHEGGQMPLFRRLPKRGFTNARFRVDYAIINVAALNDFDAGTEVDLEALKNKGLIPRGAKRLKILAKGELDRALTVRAHRFSEKAREAITGAGGSAEEVS